MPATDPRLTVAHKGLTDPLPYQIAAVNQALNPDNLRPRILLADAVGLGKAIEIGMILAKLVRRGSGERILVVTPRHVLEQMQRELWTHFSLPFVRLDSLGIQRIRQKLPANRNPFAYYRRVIVSIDTLKSDCHLAHLEKQHWDAVVIDESHNVTNSATQNNRLARLLATRAKALRDPECTLLHPPDGESPVHKHNRLFPWTLSRAFLSSPAVLAETVRERRRCISVRGKGSESREYCGRDRFSSHHPDSAVTVSVHPASVRRACLTV